MQYTCCAVCHQAAVHLHWFCVAARRSTAGSGIRLLLSVATMRQLTWASVCSLDDVQADNVSKISVPPRSDLLRKPIMQSDGSQSARGCSCGQWSQQAKTCHRRETRQGVARSAPHHAVACHRLTAAGRPGSVFWTCLPTGAPTAACRSLAWSAPACDPPPCRNPRSERDQLRTAVPHPCHLPHDQMVGSRLCSTSSSSDAECWIIPGLLLSSSNTLRSCVHCTQRAACTVRRSLCRLRTSRYGWRTWRSASGPTALRGTWAKALLEQACLHNPASSNICAYA